MQSIRLDRGAVVGVPRYAARRIAAQPARRQASTEYAARMEMEAQTHREAFRVWLATGFADVALVQIAAPRQPMPTARLPASGAPSGWYSAPPRPQRLGATET